MIDYSGKRWLLFSAGLIVLSILLLLIPVGREKAGRETLVPSGTESLVFVEKIIDGDSFILSNRDSLRLIGVDTPEEGEPFHDMAADFAESTLLGRVVRIEYDRERIDRYGRHLIYLFVDTVFYNEIIIRHGLGSVYLFRENQRYADRLISAQKEARNSETGIWSLPPPPPEDYYVSPQGSYRFHRPLCLSLKRSKIIRARKFGVRDEPLDMGLSPCRNCRP